ncbi:MAG: helix-hairpin-helix domain-containing protein [Myxococcota bacterium]|nr:helix-hairpin-helix domain-containing protein [Myxococcota bacterium]
MDDQQGTIALGVALLAVLGAIWVAAEVLGTFEDEVPPGLLDVCTEPVEIVEEGVSRLGCAADAILRKCPGVGRGDRAELSATGCAIEPGAMNAPMKIQVGVPLDLNSVTAEELTLVRGIGPKLSEAIVSHRMKFGAFGSLDELTRVHGIGHAKVAHLRAVVAVDPGKTRDGHNRVLEKTKEAQ